MKYYRMSQRYATQNNLLLGKLMKYYKKNDNLNKILTIINGEDSILCHKLHSKKILYNIRFHLTPICSCMLTNNKKSVIIKTKLNQSWIFSSTNKLKLEESIYINDGKRVERIKQIVITGYSALPKKIEKWSFSKIK